MNRTEKEEFVIGGISLLSNKLTQFGDELLPDITFKQWFLLMMISKMESDEKSINGIADFVGTTRQNVKKMLASLENKEYVRISKSEFDARALKVELTDKTYKYFIDNDKKTANAADYLFEAFTNDEIEYFANNVQKLMASFAAHAERNSVNE